MLCILLAISTLLTSWQFRREPSDQMPQVDTVWREVTIPHDWAISGPFDRENDLQKVIVVQNGENEATWKVNAIQAIAGEQLTEWYEGALEKYHVEIDYSHEGHDHDHDHEDETAAA